MLNGNAPAVKKDFLFFTGKSFCFYGYGVLS